MRRAALLALVLSTPLVVSCGRVQARTPPPAPPALDVPTPPTPLKIPVPDPVDPVKETTEAPANSTAPKPSTAPPRASSPPTTPPPPPPDGPAPVVQTSANVSEMEQKTRELLEAADRDLDRLSEGSLKGDVREQYRSARRIAQLAREALDRRNYLYAHATARKAAAMAGMLVRRLPTAL